MKFLETDVVSTLALLTFITCSNSRKLRLRFQRGSLPLQGGVRGLCALGAAWRLPLQTGSNGGERTSRKGLPGFLEGWGLGLSCAGAGSRHPLLSDVRAAAALSEP